MKLYLLPVGFALLLHYFLEHVASIPIYFVPNIVFFLTLPLIIFLEDKFPYHAEWNTNLGDLYSDMIRSLIVLPVVIKCVEILEVSINQNFFLLNWSNHLSFIPQFILVLLTSEFLFYWYHRLSHTNKALLKFHSIHHGATRLYWGNAGRFHFVDIFFSFTLYFIPVYLFRASPEVVALFLTLNVVTGTMEHANINYNSGRLSYIFNTGELHHLHHSTQLKECNSNYGKILSFWDIVFGSYLKSEDLRLKFTPGLPFNKKMPIDLIGQLKYPFIK